MDNLKLGYGGTKTEMERLLADAEKLSGQKYSIESLKDVYEAIHVVQSEMGITGTTAKEAAGTIEGSAGSVKAAWENLITAFGNSDMPVKEFAANFVSSLNNVIGNIAPRISQVLEGIGKAIPEVVPSLFETVKTAFEDAFPGLISALETIFDNAAKIFPELIDSILSLLTDDNILQSLVNTVEKMGSTVGSIISNLLNKLPSILNKLFPILSESMRDAASWVNENLPSIIDSIISTADSALSGLFAIIQSLFTGNNMKKLFGGMLSLIQKLADFIGRNLSPILDAVAILVEGLTDGLMSPDIRVQMLETGAKLVQSIIDGLVEGEAMTHLLDAVFGIVTAITESMGDPEVVNALTKAGTMMTMELVKGLVMLTAEILTSLGTFCGDIGEVITSFDWQAIGSAAIAGLSDGLLALDLTFFEDFWSNWWTGFYDGSIKDWIDYWTMFGETMYDKINEIWTEWVDFWTGYGEYLYSGVETIKKMWNDFWTDLSLKISRKTAEIIDYVNSIPDKLKEMASNAKQWGIDMLQNFIDGILSKIPNLSQTAVSIADTVSKYIHFSEPDTGPLANFHTFAPDMMELFASGIRENAGLLGKEMQSAMNFMPEDKDYLSRINTNYAPDGIQTARTAAAQDSVGAMMGTVIALLQNILTATEEGHYIDVNELNTTLGRMQAAETRRAL